MKSLMKMNTIFSKKNIVDDLQNLNMARTGIITCINPHSLVTALSDLVFYKAILNSDYVLLDGIGAYFYSKAFRLNANRITGSDYFSYWRSNLSNGRKVLFIGSTNATLRKIKQRLERECPHISSCEVFSPGFKEVFTTEDIRDWQKKIDLTKFDVIFLGLTAPKQEKLAILLRSYLLKDTLIVNIGAVFDYYAGTKAPPPKILRKLGLEWCYRLYLEPRRMYKRIFVTGAYFSFLFILNSMRNKIGSSGSDRHFEGE